MARLQNSTYKCFLCVILCRLFITSINNSSQAPTQIILIRFLKSAESNSDLAGLLYRLHSACQHPVNFIFLLFPTGATYVTPKKPTIITYLINLSIILFTLISNELATGALCPERTAHYTALIIPVKLLFSQAAILIMRLSA